jgi:hypothetical protein
MNKTIIHGIGLLMMIVLVCMGCTQQDRPSPDPDIVRNALTQYPYGSLKENTLVDDSIDDTYRIILTHNASQTDVITYYDGVLTGLGFKDALERGLTIDDTQVLYSWSFNGCPFHTVRLSMTAGEVWLYYSYGPCR